ncbi:MAG: hypothetical protein ABSD62_03280 [Candidatus Limnocylindrales bacterium]|jgi:hypothetical protein
MRIREQEVVEAVVCFIDTMGFDHVREFPLLGKVADVYGFRRDLDVSLAVECKERDWRRAIRQAVAYQVAADLVFLAMPARHVTDNVTREMRCRGIGVISVGQDGATVVVVPARSGTYLIQAVREKAIARFEAAAGVVV